VEDTGPGITLGDARPGDTAAGNAPAGLPGLRVHVRFPALGSD
jgi:hypothetical protein